MQEKDASTSATLETTRDLLVQGTDSAPGAKHRSFKSNKNENNNLSEKPIEAPALSPPVPPKSPLRPQSRPNRSEAPPTPQQFHERFASRENSSTPRQPLAELPNTDPVPPPRNIFEKPDTGSQTSLQPENFTAVPLNIDVPTLRSKRNSQTSDIPRTRSSKRKSGTKQREQEIKALSSPIPIPKRPPSFGSGILARDTKKIQGGLNKHFERPTSEVSLPVVDSIRSSMSADSEWQPSYKVSAFDALSPRPTIRYSESPRYAMSREDRASRASARRGKSPAIPEEPINAKARMDDLADDLDAKGLRELMERDRRRREKKKKSDHDKLQRKLQRRSDKQKATEAVTVAAPPQNADVEMADNGLGIGPSQEFEIGESSARPPPPGSPGSWLKDPSAERLPSPPPDPFQDPMSESRLDLRTSSEQPSMRDEPIIETAKAVRLSSASMSPPVSPTLQQKRSLGPSSLSNLAASAEHTPEASSLPEPEYLQPPDFQRDSESSSRAGGSSWTSFFRRGGTKRKGSSEKERQTPSEFSNTSRESFARQKQMAPPVAQRSFRRDGIPRRTQSKFREDLPELPISPPRSRVQSPDLQGRASPYIDDQMKLENLSSNQRVTTPIEDVHPALRDQVNISRQSAHSQSGEDPSSALLSRSLASIDSEGSWLSGKQPKRSSIPISSLRESQASLSQQLGENEEDIEEPLFARRDLTSGGTLRGPGGLSAQLRNLRASSGGDSDSPHPSAADYAIDDDLKYDTVRGHKPNIIQRGPMAKSREGLLEEYTANEEVSPISPESPESPAGAEPASIHRATSVDYGKKGHVRQLSAGSARLLNIPARSSSEHKRSSIASDRMRSPLATTPPAEYNEERERSPSPSAPSPLE